MKQVLSIITRLVKLGIFKEVLYFLLDVITDITIKLVYVLAIFFGAWLSLLGAVVGVFYLFIKIFKK